MSTRSLFLALTLSLLTATLSAQMKIDAGVAIGQQGYQSPEDDPRIVTDAELLFKRNDFGLHVVGEYADLSTVDSPFIGVHPDFIYQPALGENFHLLIGVGPSFIRVGSTVTETTWNAEAEISRAWNRAAVFARARQFDYSISSTRAGEAGPKGPVISLGVRFALVR